MDPAILLFLKHFKEKQFQEALEAIFNDPNVSFEEIDKKDDFSKYILNFADALFRFPPYHSFVAGSLLHKYIEDDIQLLLKHEDFENVLKKVCFFLSLSAADKDDFASLNMLESLEQEDALENIHIAYEKKMILCENEDFKKHLESCREKTHAILENRLNFTNHFIAFATERKALSEHLFVSGKPYQAFAYPANAEEIKAIKNFPLTLNFNDIPLILMESKKIPWDALLKPLSGRPKILLFYSKEVLIQSLQFKVVLDELLNSENLIYVLNYYGLEQFLDSSFIKSYEPFKEIKPLFITEDPYLKEDYPQILEHLKLALTQLKSETNDRDPFNWLFEVGKRHAFARDAKRYGEERFLALWLRYAYKDWNDIHKTKPKNLTMNAAMPDYLKSILDKVPPLAQRRKKEAKKPIKIAHIINTVFDEAHAPAEILRSLLENRDKTLFEASVYTTETGLYRPKEYPYYSFSGQDTLTRAKKTVQAFFSEDIPLTVLSHPFLTYEEEAKILAKKLSEAKCEIAIFHMPNPVNLLATKMLEVPCTIFMDHGGFPLIPDKNGFCLPYYLAIPIEPHFNLIITCEERPKSEIQFFNDRSTEVEALPFSLNLRKNWSQNPIPRETFDPDHNRILLTTVSLNLFNRLSPEFCDCIAKILKREKRAHYYPIGDPLYPDYFMSFFKERKVQDQVHFLGFQKNPSDFTRSMDIYLNEFPVGSGLALLEAMAAGLPIVSMYDEKDPMPAARMGAYFGKEKMITSLKNEDYVNLCCRLIEEPKLLAAWKKEALQSYEMRTDAKKYAHDFEKLILKTYEKC